MELTDKIQYLVNEYTSKYEPIINQIVSSLDIIDTMNDISNIDLNELDATEKALVLADIKAGNEAAIQHLKSKMLPIAKDVLNKASDLIIARKDAITGLSEAVDMNAEIGKLTAQTKALITSIAGMTAIAPGGAAGATILITQNAPTLVQLANVVEDKLTQTAEAAKLIPVLTNAAVKINDFIQVIDRLK